MDNELRQYYRLFWIVLVLLQSVLPVMTHPSRAMFTPVAVDLKSGQLKIKKPRLPPVFHSFFTKKTFSCEIAGN